MNTSQKRSNSFPSIKIENCILYFNPKTESLIFRTPKNFHGNDFLTFKFVHNEQIQEFKKTCLKNSLEPVSL